MELKDFPPLLSWDDAIYSQFMVDLCLALEPRMFSKGDYIVEEHEEVDEQIFVIERDFNISSVAPPTTGIYCVGFSSTTNSNKYFHVKLGPKTIISGYENLFEHPSEFTYKAISHMDAFGLRKNKIRPIFEKCPAIEKQMKRYTLEYYHTIVR